MKESSELKEYFNFLIVDDDERKIDLASMLLTSCELSSHVITGNNIQNKLHSAVFQIHKEGRFPIILLDENLGKFEPSGTDIAISLTRSFRDVGGILLPFSSNCKEQCDNWWYEIKDKGSWVLSDQGMPLTEYIYDGEIDALCTDFLEGFNKREDQSEIKNG